VLLLLLSRVLLLLSSTLLNSSSTLQQGTLCVIRWGSCAAGDFVCYQVGIVWKQKPSSDETPLHAWVCIDGRNVDLFAG